GVPRRGILDPDDPANPAARFDMAYVPYCDGTLFIGDTDVDSNGDGLNDRFFRGLQNLSAALNVIHATYAAPRRILLAGNSAGGLGVHFALPLVRKLYPETPIDLVNDSGVGIYEPGAVETLIQYWNGSSAIPADCEDCIGDDGNLTGFHAYQLEEDAGLRMAFLSSRQDEVITGTFGLIAPEAFEAQLLEAVDELATAHPDRFASLIAAGEEHTFIQRQFGYPIADTTVRQWIAEMLSGSSAWTSRAD
ncbi:MAG: pectin acetylesterase-family hydrolase, partial [Pseudomonadales bacterium]|nr:pectin acetylesterase-family hydrolase [Pseudomonadales bacterium]